ncbi:hypothetical protein HZA86_05210 [Candidatus Uhrbacteria bacterium]|nr:hypothetical protein [Candidatus Uhrbacteria bacterium]
MNKHHYHIASMATLGVLAMAAMVVIPNWVRPGQSFGNTSESALDWTVVCSTTKPDASNRYHCTNALPNASGEWVSDGQGSGAFIEVQFPKEVILESIRLFDRGSALQSITDGHFEFFDGSRLPAPRPDGSIAGIASLADPGFPNATVMLAEPKRTLGFRFVIDAVSGTTTDVGLAEIAPRFTVPADARVRPRRLVGTVGVAYHDVNGVLPLGPVRSSTSTEGVQIQAQESVVGPTDPPSSEAAEARLEVSLSRELPLKYIFSSGERSTQWIQYRLTARGADVVVSAIPVVLTAQSQSRNNAVVAPLSSIHVFADTDPTMRHQIALGSDRGVALDARGKARIDFSEEPLRIPNNSSVYVVLSGDLNRIGSDIILARLGIEPGIAARNAVTLEAVSVAITNPISATEAESTVGAHMIIPSLLLVEQPEDPIAGFTGGRIDEAVFRFGLRSETTDIRVKTIEFVGTGSCNNGMNKPGRARLVEITDPQINEVAVWENVMPNNLIYSTYRNTPIRLGAGQAKIFELRMDTQCDRAQQLQFHIGGADSFPGAHATVSGIQWFMPFMSAAMAVDLPSIPGLPFHGPVLVAGGAVPSKEDAALTVDSLLSCNAASTDRPSYPLTIEAIGLLPNRYPAAGGPSTMVFAVKNRSDVGQTPDISIDWGDGKRVQVPSNTAIFGSAQANLRIDHTFAPAPTPDGWPVQVELRSSSGDILSAAQSCPVIVTPGQEPSSMSVADESTPSRVIIAPDDSTSVGMQLNQLQTIQSLTLALEGVGASTSSVAIFVAGADGVYRPVAGGDVMQSWQQSVFHAQFPRSIAAQSIKVRITRSASSAGDVVMITSLSNALSVYAPAGASTY